MSAAKPVTAADVEQCRRDLERVILHVAPVMKRICNKHQGETPLEVATIQAADCAWRLLDLFQRVRDELARESRGSETT